MTLALDGSHRAIRLGGDDIESLRLAYAQHVYRQQGATVDRAVVLSQVGCCGVTPARWVMLVGLRRR
jgi:hypothetical protein